MDKSNPRKWRLIVSTAASGKFNMAVDESIMHAVSQNEAPPTLRLYAWDPACVSLGYAQPFEQLDVKALTRMGWDVVRRSTGGRAILHTDEITYAIIGPDTHPVLEGGVLESYRKISIALVDGLQRLGARITIHPHQQLDQEVEKDPICFQNPSAYEIKHQDRKLLGSAQVRRKRVILQHGTLPLCGDIARICKAIRYPDPATQAQAAEHVYKNATTLEEVVGRHVTWEEAVESLTKGFTDSLGLNLVEGSMTDFEREHIEISLLVQHGSEAWIKRR